MPPPPALRPDTLAAVRVDRARLELRHGRAIALRATDDAGAWQLMTAVETLSEAQFGQWVSLGLPLRLLLTAERLQALVAAAGDDAMTLPLLQSATLERVRALAAVVPAQSTSTSLQGALPADAAQRAALALVKRARLAPALLLADLPQDDAWALWRQRAQVLCLAARDLAQAAPPGAALRRVSQARVPIEAAEHCEMLLYREVEGDAEHLAIVVGELDRNQPVPVRVHSACLTGDLLGSLRCDCGEQLRGAAERLAATGGVLLYLAQEGRGTGLASKLRAYRLQDGGLDTLQADRYLGFRADERDFQPAAAMLHDLGLRRIRLLTNNPHKIDALRAAGIEVVERVPLNAPVNGHNRRYMQTKHELAGHWRADDRPA